MKQDEKIKQKGEIKYIIHGYCAFNRGIDPSITEISFEDTSEDCVRNWGEKRLGKQAQDIRKCEVIIYE